MKVLIIGSSSYASKGLPKLLAEENFEVFCFNRGKVSDVCPNTTNITGSVWDLLQHKDLNQKFDIVINYILLKGQSIADNLNFIDLILNFCKSRGVKTLIHISTISVYPNNAIHVDENSPIEYNLESKGAYSALKTAADIRLLESQGANNQFKILFVRPGFILDLGIAPSHAGIIFPIINKLGILLGDKNTVLPIIYRDDLNNAILSILNRGIQQNVLILTSSVHSTKYAVAKEYFNYNLILLPKKLVLLTACLFFDLKILNLPQYNQIRGLFKVTNFDNSKTKEYLKLEF